MSPEKKKKKYRFLKIFAKIFLGILLFLILLLLFIRSPWGQGIIVDKATSYVSDKTNTRVDIERLFITFAGNVYLEGLFLEDKKGDTLLYSKNLEVDVPLWPIIRGSGISVNKIEWEGLRANIVREDTIQGFNFQFLIDAFASEEEKTVQEKDTIGDPMQFKLGRLHFKEFDLVYDDAVTGIDTRLRLGELNLKMKEMDLEKMQFHATEAEIFNTDIHYLQTLPFPESDDTKDSTLPYIIVDNFTIKNLTADYQSLPDGFAAVAAIGELSLQDPKANLGEYNVTLGYLGLHNSTIAVETTTLNDEKIKKEAEEVLPSKEKPQFTWPDWIINAQKIDLTNNTLSYSVDGAKPKPGLFNAQAIYLDDFNFVANDIYLEDNAVGLKLDTFSFKEGSGIDLHEFSMNITLDENNTTVSGLGIHLNENRISGDIGLRYSSIDELINNFENIHSNVELSLFELSLADLFRFQPELRNNEYLLALSKKKVTGNLRVNGQLSSLQIPSTTIRWGNNTRLTAQGALYNVTDTDNLRLDFPQINLVSTRRDIITFIDEEELGIRVPKDVSLSGNFNGELDDIEAVAKIKTTDGDIDIVGGYLNKDILAFNADVDVKKLQLGKILQNEQLGELSLKIKTTGKGNSVNELDAVFEATITKFQMPDYTIEDLTIAGDIENGEGFINSEYKDENIDLTFQTLVQLDSVSPRFVVDLNLIGADFQALGVTKKNVRGKMMLRADFKGSGDAFEMEAMITDAVAIYDQQPYLLGDVDIYSYIKPDTTSVVVFNRLIQLDLHSNSNPAGFAKAMQRHVESYFTEGPVPQERDTVINPVEVYLRGNISQAPILRDILIPGIQQMDTISIRMDFQEQNRTMTANIHMPHLKYAGTEVDSLSFSLDSNGGNFDFLLGFKEVNTGPISMKKTSLAGSALNNTLFLDFNSVHEQDTIIKIKSEISRSNEITRFHIDPEGLILNKRNWIIPPENEILLSDEKIDFNDFRLSYQSQLLAILSDRPEVEKDHIAMQFDNFRLAGLLAFLNPEENLVIGTLNGNIILEEPMGSTGLLADLVIDNMHVMEVPLGNLTLDAKSLSGDNYDFKMAIKGGDIDLDLTGDFKAEETAASLNLDLDINEVKMRALEGFTKGQIKDGEGGMSGRVKISGTTAEPIYEGNLNFNNAQFNIAQLNAIYRLPNENLRVDNDGIYLSNFTIQDENNNNFLVNGEIKTEKLANPDFDLQLKANNFKGMNSTREDNDLFYGTAIFDLDAKITGNLLVPRVDATIDVRADTDVTYIIPESELDIIDRDNVIIFVNREDPEDILTRTQEESVIISGFEISAIINIHRDAVFNVIINERTGDNLAVSGEGNLSFNIYPNGRTTLSGRYIVNDGHFEMNLYNLVRRRFEIAPGGRIVWSGDPIDADIDIRAIYRVEAAATPLMASRLAGADASVSSRFRQQLPFLVYLNVSGEMMEPKLEFSLDMPEEERGAIGGEVYGRVQQLNQQEEEMNKQVFSLLVLNRFFPDTGSDGSGGGAEAIARDNVSQALSGQLNTLSDRLLGKSGIELDFGLDSYTDYQGTSPEERTQLDITAQKKLFDDRLIVSVGSEVDIQGRSQVQGETSPIIGNVSIEYLMTEDGRFRLKGFRRNQFENVIDGQLIVNGIALIFTREFNKFKELWEAKLEEEIPDVKAEISQSEENDTDDDEENNDNTEEDTEE